MTGLIVAIVVIAVLLVVLFAFVLPRSREKVQEVDDIVAKSKAAVARRQANSPPTPSPKIAPKRPDEQLNLVLDKISEQGLDSLTSDERRILEEMSRKLKDRD